MTYRLTAYGKTRAPLPGVPWRDLSDDEMAAAESRHPGIGKRGYFRRDTPVVAKQPEAKPEPTPTPRRGYRPKKES